MNARLILTALLALTGCAHNKAQPPQPSSLVEKLKAKYDGWQAELAAASDKNTGWLSLDDCDGTLWTGEAVASGHTGQLVLAEWDPGEIHRRPKASGECWPEESASTVSNDMLTGYLLGMCLSGDLQALERLEAYGEAHNWVMGQPLSATQVVFSPAGQGLLARCAAKLGGEKKSYAAVPEPCLPVASDYEKHLQTLAVYLDGDVSGSVSDLCLAELKKNAEAAPNDALMAAVAGVYTGDESRGIGLLLGDGYLCPTYVRPVPAYCTIHRAFAAKIILKRFGDIP